MALPECLRRAACALLACCSAAALADEPVHSWNFRVYLNHDLIGYHDFTLTSLGAARELRSAAHFLVKVLFINAYHYDHHAAEIWHGDCLERLESHSDDDGKMLSVHVHSVGHELDVEATDAHYSLPGCAMTFAYWNPVMLLQNHLINPETGEDVPVDIRLNGEEDIQVRNESVHAKHYHLHSAKMAIDLWYSAHGDWLALETPEKGRRLRYVLN